LETITARIREYDAEIEELAKESYPEMALLKCGWRGDDSLRSHGSGEKQIGKGSRPMFSFARDRSAIN
jgi:hypothetical protein